MDTPSAEVRFAAGLRMFLAPRHRAGPVRVACDGVSSLGHVVESLGVPLPEAGALTVNGRPAAFSRCAGCGRVYWRGAHSQRLQRVVDSALATVAAVPRA